MAPTEARTPLVAVIGNGTAHEPRDALAERVGEAIVACGCGIVTGGLGGVMEAASRGAAGAAKEDPALVVAILPGTEKLAANPHANVVIPTGLGYARNLLVVLTADAVVAIGGESGTLSELAHAWQLGKPVCALADADGWAQRLAGEQLDSKRDDAIARAETPEQVAQWLRDIGVATR